ncbi:uncharacterized protein LOC120991641 [Bufo bufo]|uniref:uncharacterized protein LOC120991641 n=1 Tax=Bufo bufo TaxID=8384 RepID=UPI001ABE4A0F|nr:uncharacterized protein LOC120991641 [Bufo bufo]
MDCGFARRSSFFGQPVYVAASLLSTDTPPLCAISINGHPVKALLDSGSLVTLVHESLVASRGPGKQTIRIVCIHGDQREYPTTCVTLSTLGREIQQVVGVGRQIPYAAILGRDCPLFWSLWEGRGAEPVPVDPEEELPAVGVTNKEEECQPDSLYLEGLAGEPVAAPSVPELEVSRDTFGTAQLQDPTLSRAREGVTVINGVAQHPGADSEFPHLACNQDLLYRVDKVRQEEAVWEADRSVGLSAVVRSSNKNCPIAAGSEKDQKKGSCGRSQSLVQADTWPV